MGVPFGGGNGGKEAVFSPGGRVQCGNREERSVGSAAPALPEMAAGLLEGLGELCGGHERGIAEASAEVLAEVVEARGVGGEGFGDFDELGGSGGGEVCEGEVGEEGVDGFAEGVGVVRGEVGGEGNDGDAHEEGVEGEVRGVDGEGVEGDVDGVKELEMGETGLWRDED